VRSHQAGFARRSAERVAREIELDIVANARAVGDSLGSEPELMQRYEVSRGVIREAITIVEHHRQAETRRGVGGGLVVAEPDLGVITEVASLYLARKGVSVADLLQTRLLLEGQAVDAIIEALDADKLTALRCDVDRLIDAGDDLAEQAEYFHLLLADLSGNGILNMVIPIMSGLVKEVWNVRKRRPTVGQQRLLWADIAAEHRAIVEAIAVGDRPAAHRALQTHLTNALHGVADCGGIIAPLALTPDGRGA
jgi:DNA-binding FadR family transcriptional regulator